MRAPKQCTELANPFLETSECLCAPSIPTVEKSWADAVSANESDPRKEKGRGNSSALFPRSTNSLLAVILRNRGANSLDLGVLLEDLVTHLAAPTGLFVSAEREGGVKHVVAIDPNGSGAEHARDLVSFLDVASPHTGGQTVDRVVCLRGNFLDIAERNRGDHGTENLFPHHFHFFVGVHQDRGLYEVTFVPVSRSSGDRLGALRDPRFEIAANSIQLFFGNKRAHVARRIHAGGDMNVFGNFRYTFHDFVENFVFDEKPRARAAAL